MAEPLFEPGAPGNPWTFEKIVAHFGSTDAAYRAAVTGLVHPALVDALFDTRVVATYHVLIAIERLTARLPPPMDTSPCKPLSQILHEAFSPRPSVDDAIKPVRCPECSAMAGAAHSPNCPHRSR